MSYPDPEIVKSDGLLRLKWRRKRTCILSRSALLWYGGYGLSQPGTGSASLKSVLERGHLGYPKIPDLVL